MRNLLILAGAFGMFAGQALAEEVVITKETTTPGVVVEKQDTTVTKEVRRGDDCATKTVTKSDGMGDSVSKTKTNC